MDIDDLNGLQEITFEGCGYCLISPEDRDAVVASHKALTKALRDIINYPNVASFIGTELYDNARAALPVVLA